MWKSSVNTLSWCEPEPSCHQQYPISGLCECRLWTHFLDVSLSHHATSSTLSMVYVKVVCEHTFLTWSWAIMPPAVPYQWSVKVVCEHTFLTWAWAIMPPAVPYQWSMWKSSVNTLSWCEPEPSCHQQYPISGLCECRLWTPFLDVSLSHHATSSIPSVLSFATDEAACIRWPEEDEGHRTDSGRVELG